MTSKRRPSRRSVLRAALAVTGLASSGLAARFGPLGDGEDAAQSGSTAGAGRAIASSTLYLDHYSMHTGDRARGAERRKGDQTILRGTLTTPAGTPAGEVFASAITMPGPVDPDTPQTPRMEIQNFQLTDGTIFGMGTVFSQVDIPNIYTIIGGSGRYTGARGTYTFEDNPSVASSEGRATLTFDLVA